MADLISSPDSNNLQRHNVGDMKDMISNLPDSILHYILSLLPTKGAIQTSVLAKSWKYLWTDLSAFDFIKIFLTTFLNRRQESAKCLLDQVDRLLYHSSCVKRLSVTIIQPGSLLSGIYIDVDRVNSVISAAVKHNIEELKLSLHLKDPFVLPHCFSASESLNKLVLELGCVLSVPSGIHFPSLKTLKLSHVSFENEKSFQQLLSGCPVLRELTLCRCFWTNIEQISITTPTLKILTISCGSADRPDSVVKINVVNVLNFRLSSYQLVEFVLVNLSFIVNAYIDAMCYHPPLEQNNGARTIKLLSGLGSIKSLYLSNHTLECLSNVKNTLHLLPLFNNLTHLDVDLRTWEFTIEGLMEILQKTPKLEVLHIPMGFHPQICLDGEDWILNSEPFCFKYSLKLFSIAHFDGGEDEIQLLKFFLENATVVAEIRILCSKALSADLKKQAEISNQLQPVGLGSCVIKFQ